MYRRSALEKRNIGCILEQGNRLNVDEAKLKIWKNNMNMVFQDLAPIYISGRSQDRNEAIFDKNHDYGPEYHIG